MAKLSAAKGIAYGMGGLTMSLPDLIVMQWLIVRYVPPDADKHLIAPALFGFIVLCGRMTEGLSNPPIGNWSDGCRTRWGRRMPFMRLGIVPIALTFFLLFNPPIDHLHWANAVYAVALFMLYSFLYTTIVTPYLALLPEIATGIKERVNLTTFQSVFVMIATFVFAAMGLILERFGWTALSACAAGLMLLFFIPVCTLIQEKPQASREDQPRLRLWHSIRLALANRPFRFVLASTALYWFGLNGVLALVPHWTVSYLGRTEGDVTTLMVPFLVVNLVFFFVFNALTPRFGKHTLMLATFLGSGLAFASLATVGLWPWGSPFAQTAVVIALCGAPAAGFMVLPFACLADVADYDERLTGRRREAVFFGVQGIGQKTMIGLSVLTFTMVPYLGQAPGATAPTPFGLKLMAVLCGLACIAAFLVFIRYPIRDHNGIVTIAE